MNKKIEDIPKRDRIMKYFADLPTDKEIECWYRTIFYNSGFEQRVFNNEFVPQEIKKVLGINSILIN